MNDIEDEMRSLFEFSSIDEKKVTVENRKKISKFMKESRSAAKRNKCFHCKKEVSSFCNSHSVPAFTLRNIAKNGNLVNLNNFIEIPFQDKQSGLQKTGTFQIICKNCDNTIFADYENPENYDTSQSPSQKMLSQIALKSYLLAINKKFVEMEMFKKTGLNVDYIMQLMEAEYLDYEEYYDGYKKAKRNLEKDWSDYFLIYYKKLDYTVPIAFQDKIALINSFDNEIINNIYNFEPNYHAKDLHICVFPLESSTAIIMFVHNKDASRYRKFYKEFRKMNEEEKLEIINFLIIAYSENFFLSPYLPHDILDNKELNDVAKLSSNAVIGTNDTDNVKPMKLLAEKYSYAKAKAIPNFLLLDISKLK